MTERFRAIGRPAPTTQEVLQARAARAFLAANFCTASRDPFAGAPEAGTVLQTCELTRHNDSFAHRMTNPDGSVTTWRS
jgi:hypothetical protein